MESNFSENQSPLIVVAGATGQLGERIVHYLIANGARVNALVKKGSRNPNLVTVQNSGAQVLSSISMINQRYILHWTAQLV